MKLFDHIIRLVGVCAIALCGYMLFYKLGEGYLISTDEAYHATNAYEMLKQENWIVNSYRYAADYFNSKPPLCLDIMVLSYKFLGINSFAARFPSALGGLLTILLISVFLYKKVSGYSAAIFSLLFITVTEFFTFHMYRAAEMDSIFNLFFSICMIALFMMREKPAYMYLYGLFLGLAFLCKGPHAALIFLIGLLYIPQIKAAFLSIKRVLISVFLACAIPLIWAAMRFSYDGTELFKALFVGEVYDRISESDASFILPIKDLASSKIFMVFIITLLLVIVLGVISLALEKGRNSSVISEIKTKSGRFFRENYLFILWVAVPVLFFSFTRSFLSWYTYSSKIALCILTANLFGSLIENAAAKKAFVAYTALTVITAICLFNIIPCIRSTINQAGQGGHPVDKLSADLLDFENTYKDQFSGTNAYLISDFRQHSEQGHWEPEYVAPAEMYCDLIPVDGGVDSFLNDPDSILILDKNLWDDYSDVLTGHVILLDDSYLVFSSDMY